ncbi:MAG: RNA polymerase sigma factor [Phycisphaerales bacterium]
MPGPAETEWLTTTILLERLSNFEDAAWDTFTARFREPLIAFARRCGLDADAAQDIAQDALFAFARSYRQGRFDRTRGRLRSWLFGIAHKEILKQQRKRARGERQSPMVHGGTTFFSQLEDEDDAARVFDTMWDEHVARLCMARVQREVEPLTWNAFEQFALRGQNAADVAAELRMSRNAVFLAKHRILKRLRELTAAFEDTGDAEA